MTNTMTERRHVQPGDVIHAVQSGLKLDETTGPMSRSIELHRGREIELNEQLIDASRDRLGNTFLDLVHYPEEQVRRWGQVKLAFGPRPIDFRDIEPGTTEAEIARENDREMVKTMTADPRERQMMFKAIDEEFGRPVTSQTVGEYDGGRHAGFPRPSDD